jgi:hypothetical protein
MLFSASGSRGSVRIAAAVLRFLTLRSSTAARAVLSAIKASRRSAYERGQKRSGQTSETMVVRTHKKTLIGIEIGFALLLNLQCSLVWSLIIIRLPIFNQLLGDQMYDMILPFKEKLGLLI